MRRVFWVWATVGLAIFAATGGLLAEEPSPKYLIAHRGASAYAPELTAFANALAIEQKVDYIEIDLQVTKDGELVSLHDGTLERTTNVEEVFPDRFKMIEGKKRWPVTDFTLEEIKQLDAGSWYAPKFAGAKILTFQEVLDQVRGKTGLLIEMKDPESYAKRGMAMEPRIMEVLKKNGLDQPGADPKTPIIIQSFGAGGVKALKHDLGCKLPLVFLLGGESGKKWLTEEGLKEVSTFATGIGPSKQLVAQDPAAVTRAHALGLTVFAYTFRAGKKEDYDACRAEMREFLYTFGGDGAITDNPDLFPRSVE